MCGLGGAFENVEARALSLRRTALEKVPSQRIGCLCKMG